jgi:cell division septation protein DedD
MAIEVAARPIIAIPGPLKREDPEQLIPQVRSQIRILNANLVALRRELSSEVATSVLEVPSDKGVDKNKLDAQLAKVKPQLDRITLVQSLLEIEWALKKELKEAYPYIYLVTLKKEREELIAACKKECEVPMYDLAQEINEMEQAQAAAYAGASAKYPEESPTGQVEASAKYAPGPQPTQTEAAKYTGEQAQTSGKRSGRG